MSEELEPECDGTLRCPAPFHEYTCRAVEVFLHPERFWAVSPNLGVYKP